MTPRRGLEGIPLRISLQPETAKPTYELHFVSLRRAGTTIAVPCSENGVVDLDQLEDEARDAYLYAHMLVGLEFAKPTVICACERPA
jgi:hypothetical protein